MKFRVGDRIKLKKLSKCDFEKINKFYTCYIDYEYVNSEFFNKKGTIISKEPFPFVQELPYCIEFDNGCDSFEEWELEKVIDFKQKIKFIKELI